jgi:hypothetical protein
MVQFRLGQQEALSLDFEPTDTIADCRPVLAERLDLDPSGIRFVFKGKILGHGPMFGSLNLGKGDFIVIDMVKPKAPAEPPPWPAPLPARAPLRHLRRPGPSRRRPVRGAAPRHSRPGRARGG